MSTPIIVTQEQYDRWTEHLEGAGKCRNFASKNHKFLTLEKEERIVRTWNKNKGSILATCRDLHHSAPTVRKVLRERGLIR